MPHHEGTYSLALSTFALVEIDTFAPGFLALLPPKMTHLGQYTILHFNHTKTNHTKKKGVLHFP